MNASVTPLVQHFLIDLQQTAGNNRRIMNPLDVLSAGDAKAVPTLPVRDQIDQGATEII